MPIRASVAAGCRGGLFCSRSGELSGVKALPDKDKQVRPLVHRDGTAPAPSDRDTGAALRSIYQRTIEERIPDEMLDLLGKLD